MLFVNKKLWQVFLTRQCEKYLLEIPLTPLDTARCIVICALCSAVLENVFSKKCNPQEVEARHFYRFQCLLDQDENNWLTRQNLPDVVLILVYKRCLHIWKHSINSQARVSLDLHYLNLTSLSNTVPVQQRLFDLVSIVLVNLQNNSTSSILGWRKKSLKKKLLYRSKNVWVRMDYSDLSICP